jgi:hypothetical protein
MPRGIELPVHYLLFLYIYIFFYFLELELLGSISVVMYVESTLCALTL